ncbi:TetR/AcrR family transcriptional regulator [Jongsikchunia kroppenstedtii]|uniref:TetR/AcrR family transcriptional regulator n=1 Tax=Jongsikchunia kroppenstedtii TaxID=1121721 RepID=UPI0004761F11|nr:TetR/AcrR family transcriptional regulator [Jongsikchunia kroppenstedtii]
MRLVPTNGPRGEVPERFVAAVAQTLMRLGLQRFSLSAAADQARVSRGTMYNWFGGKQDAIDVGVRYMASAFIDMLGVAVGEQDSLRDEIGAAAAALSEHRRWSDQLDPTMHTSGLLELVFEVCGDDLMQRSVEFWVPRIKLAKTRGEVDADLPTEAAADWIIRGLMSIEVLPVTAVDLSKPEAVREHFSRFIMGGLAERRS